MFTYCLVDFSSFKSNSGTKFSSKRKIKGGVRKTDAPSVIFLSVCFVIMKLFSFCVTA